LNSGHSGEHFHNGNIRPDKPQRNNVLLESTPVERPLGRAPTLKGQGNIERFARPGLSRGSKRNPIKSIVFHHTAPILPPVRWAGTNRRIRRQIERAATES
jgi:hypothetical protein